MWNVKQGLLGLIIWLRTHHADQDSVRLLAVESCGAFAGALSKEDAVAHLLPIVHKFAQARTLTSAAEAAQLNCWMWTGNMWGVCDQMLKRKQLCGVFLQDKSWRVRYNVANQLVQMCEALGPDVTRYGVYSRHAQCS